MISKKLYLKIDRVHGNSVRSIGEMFLYESPDIYDVLTSLVKFKKPEKIVRIIKKYLTMELPDKGNQRRVSRIVEGVYKAVIHDSPKFGRCLWIKDVPGRSEILIHPANWPRDLLGCIGPGEWNNDDRSSIDMVKRSRISLKSILDLMDKRKQSEIWIEISNKREVRS